MKLYILTITRSRIMYEKVLTLILLRISLAIDEGIGMKADGRGKKDESANSSQNIWRCN